MGRCPGDRCNFCGRIEDLASLVDQIGAPAICLALDIRNRKEVTAALENLPAEFQAIDVLVNNAGLGRGLDKLHEGRVDELRAFLETTLVAAAEDADKLSEAGVRAPKMILPLYPLAGRVEQYVAASGLGMETAVKLRQVADRLAEDSS